MDNLSQRIIMSLNYFLQAYLTVWKSGSSRPDINQTRSGIEIQATNFWPCTLNPPHGLVVIRVANHPHWYLHHWQGPNQGNHHLGIHNWHLTHHYWWLALRIFDTELLWIMAHRLILRQAWRPENRNHQNHLAANINKEIRVNIKFRY